ncbi:unnamed protein product, partial [Meganyctiphanes norvegica]
VNVRVGMSTEDLPNLPNVMWLRRPGTMLYLPKLTNSQHIEWAVDTAKNLQPSRFGFIYLYLPSCGLCVNQLCDLVSKLASAKVIVRWAVVVSSNHSDQEVQQLEEATRNALNCALCWDLDDDQLSGPDGKFW